jgi:hypothetical protein
MTAKKVRRGPRTLYPKKDRTRSIHVQMPPRLHNLLDKNLKRTKVRAGDFMCALIEKYGDEIELTPTLGE